MFSSSTRGLRFIQVFLQSLADGEKDDSNPNLIRVNVTKAYEIALKRYHGWLVQQLFKVSSVFYVRCISKTAVVVDLFVKKCTCATVYYKMHRVVFKFFICICSCRQLFSLLRISRTSWRLSPKVGTSKKRSAWKKSESSSSTSRLLLMLFMSSTIRWMLILITQCDRRTLLSPPVIHFVYKVIYILQSTSRRRSLQVIWQLTAGVYL